jgi:two-component system chemotaxis sensor kinase CheA
VSIQDENNNFFTEFLDDYFAEAEEHLIIVRNQLLALEPYVDQPEIDSAILHTLFRSFHTLKGLSGMVGVKEAEELAHQMESYLRTLRDDKVVLSSIGFDALLNGTKVLEKVIESYQNQEDVPEIHSIVQKLKSIIPENTPKPSSQKTTPVQIELKQEATEQVEEATEQGSKAWHFVFTSSPELAAKGINVTVIRNRIENLGKLIHVAPRMTPDGKICFDFVVATETQESEFSYWKEDGVTWSLYKQEEESKSPETNQQESIVDITDDKKEEAEKENTNNLIDDIDESKPESVNILESIPEDEKISPSIPITKQTSTVVRVDLAKLDDLMRMVGDLVISRARLEDNIKHINGNLKGAEKRSLQEINLTLERQLRDLREGVMRVRLVPIGEVFARMKFVVRDLVRESNKQVNLEIIGQETEIDKFVVERMLDPLLHLVRNSVSHGIETPEERQQKGKPAEGNISLRAKTSGEIVIIQIEDDGRGVDISKVIQRGKEKGLLRDNEKDKHYDSVTILELLCSPGFSTKEQADLTSGRGVGMAVVKNTVAELGGVIDLKTEKDKGTCFTIQLPLTLAIADSLIISLEQQIFAIPQSAVREVTNIDLKEITTFENNEIISYRGQVLPLIRLTKLFGITKSNNQKNNQLRIVIVGSQNSAVGLVVDRIIGMREIVVRSLTDPFVQVVGIAGATELGDGRVVLILDVGTLIRTSSKTLTY